MSRIFPPHLLVILLLAGGCNTKSQSELSKALSGAVKEKKLSQKKMENILQEYGKLRDEDREKAREYVLQVLNTIEMGGDSSHLEVVRKQVLEKKAGKGKAKV